jgi:putative two-component system response regulator
MPADSSFDTKSARILAVDDEPANLKLLGLMLRTAGYHDIELVQDPREALGSYLRARPDLILLDINMPHLDGFGVMEQIRGVGDPLAPPIVILTAQSGDDFLLRALNAGATDFLSKPFNRRELLARANNILLAHLARQAMLSQNTVLEQMVQQRTRELSQSRLDIVHSLGRAAEFRDNETGQHVMRMSHASTLLARSIGWSRERCELMLHASPMHDVGKIGIPDRILLKPGPLTPEERRVMQTHTTVGAAILAGGGSDLMVLARDIAISHHEKWDGSGYPHGLAGEAIPEAARIVAISDVFDALTSARPYKPAWPVDEAITYMHTQSGIHFEPRLLEHFVALVPQVQGINQRFAEPLATEPAPFHTTHTLDRIPA